MRFLLVFLLPHRRAMLLGLVLGLLANAAGLATPMVTKWVLDTLAAGNTMGRPLGALLALVVIGAAITLWQWRMLGALAERIVLDARARVIDRFFRAEVLDLQKRPTGELVTRATSDTGLVHAASSSVIGLINASISFVGTLVLMGVLDLVLLGYTVAAVVIVGTLMGLLMPRIAKAEAAAQDSIGKLGGALEGALRAIRTVKASRAEVRQSSRIIADARDAAAHSVTAARVTATVWTIAWTGIQLAVIAILGIGAWRAHAGLLEVSSLIAFLLYAFQLMGPISELTQNFTALQSGIAAAGRIREVEAIPVEAAESAKTVLPQGVPDEILVFEGVSARYAADTPLAVRDINLAIPRIGHTAIVGPSGSGKTTLFSLILRFLQPQSGRIRLDGRPYETYSHEQVRARLAYVEQETPVVPGTIRDNLRFTHPDATDAELFAVLEAVRLDLKVAALPEGLDTSLASTEVSGGERQRIALARAMLRTPDILLLDEATAQVDGLTEAALHDCIRERAATGAVITIAHRLSTVLDADRIIVMEDGRIRAQGTHDELLESDDLYRRLVEALRIAQQVAPVG
ncbi:ABC transporter ATP-binding protein [Allorhizocola rhizosphaerae]|uniref:ABC transporter ATP-binding protein n=1 Tax=Allorhizocola rhizosphaerae TaxID=1872709 RepID=UPI000E3DA4CD|nr:ABC transporter ATP-binding protein [Allorhizocola rhizosphaerae]